MGRELLVQGRGMTKVTMNKQTIPCTLMLSQAHLHVRCDTADAFCCEVFGWVDVECGVAQVSSSSEVAPSPPTLSRCFSSCSSSFEDARGPPSPRSKVGASRAESSIQRGAVWATMSHITCHWGRKVLTLRDRR